MYQAMHVLSHASTQLESNQARLVTDRVKHVLGRAACT